MWAVGSDGQRYEAGVDAANSRGVQITSGAANTKGSYTTVLTTTFNASKLLVFLSRSSSSNDWLVDIALDLGGGTFQVIAENLLLSPFDTNLTAVYELPFEIPSGSVIAARCQCSSAVANQTIGVGVMAAAEGLDAPSLYTGLLTFGANTADSGGTSVDSGPAANTEGAWQELTSSVPRDLSGLIVAFGGQVNTARINTAHAFDVGVGAAGSEQVIISNIPANQTQSGDTVMPPCTLIFRVPIPAGTRLSARQQCNTTDATDRLVDVVAYGLY